MIIHYSTYIDITNNLLLLSDDEATHCYKVLRSRVGDTIYVTDGEGSLHTAVISEINKTRCQARIIESVLMARPLCSVTIAICPTKKQSRIEWFVQKAVEIGVSKIIIMQTSRTEKSRLKQDRLERIITSAMKQSKNLYRPTLNIGMQWSEVASITNIESRYIAHCENPETHISRLYSPGNDCIIAIGPEGDFTTTEIKLAVDKGWKEINLGSSRLRTETAGVVAVATISQCNNSI